MTGYNPFIYPKLWIIGASKVVEEISNLAD
jgi:hypothetical protein